MIFEIRDPLEAFLSPGPLIDFEAPAIEDFVRAELARRSPVDAAARAFVFVRDAVRHSWDAQTVRVTRSASETLLHREGICYAKSHLLAALLRKRGIPTAMCYQRLTLLDDASAGHAIHALNAVYFANAWHRIDARGNKPGVEATFSLTGERLAFAIRPAFAECDYRRLYAQPHPVIARTLFENRNALEMYRYRLPDRLEV